KHLGFTVEDDKLGLTRGQAIGAIGTATKRQTLRDLVEQVDLLAGSPAHVYEYGPQTIRRLGVVTGGGQGYVLEAIACGCDTFLTGEIGEPTEGIVREEGINFIAVGHYNSEKLGVQALGNLLQTQFGIETFFCDVPNKV
ncbi:MAG TPA: Nif3-like dinuclear metal center hexameric protein, partial [Ktedonobacteraceae bacterium]|nr:Nif3-like dinuclear metal center hexameric protein [Ktedonobacteraceae bacterium]